MTGATSTEALASALDPEHLAAIRIEDTHGEEALDERVDAYCRSKTSVAEITAYRQLAGLATPRTSRRCAA